MSPLTARTARLAGALTAAALLTAAAPADPPTAPAAPAAAAATPNAPPGEPPLLVESQRFVAGKVSVAGRTTCFDDGRPQGSLCQTSVRAVAAGSACDAAAQGAGDAPADVAGGGGEWSLAGLEPGTFYTVYARATDGVHTRCSIAVRLLTPRDDNTLEAPVLDPFTGRIESPAVIRGTTVEGLLAVYRNGTPLTDLVAPLAWGEFIANVPLVKGLNKIEVRAVNPYSGEQSPLSNALELRVGL
jgi:hypothetical protein